MTRRLSSVAALVFGTMISGSASAQQIELPRPSPNAKIVQTVGLTELTVDYSCPRVNGRKVFGDLLPWGKVWRAGANSITKLTVSKDVTIAGTKLPAGSYGLFVVPQKTGPWTVAVSKVWQGSPFDYKPENDVVRASVTPSPLGHARERLAYEFDDFASQNGVSLVLEWDKTRLALPIKLDTEAQVKHNISDGEATAWAPYNNAARYMLEQQKDYDAGMKLVDKSIAIEEVWSNDWTKAQLTAAKGDKKGALALAQKADALGQKIPPQLFFGKDEIEKTISEWKAKK